LKKEEGSTYGMLFSYAQHSIAYKGRRVEVVFVCYALFLCIA